MLTIHQILISLAILLALGFSQPVYGTSYPAQNAVILALGDSLTAGYGLAQDKSFPAVLEKHLRERGLPLRVINAGVSGDTSADGLARLDWVLAGLPPDTRILAIVELGANDALRGIDPDITRQNLTDILQTLQGRNIPVLLAGMLAPPNMGRDFTARFNAIFPDLAREFQLQLFPFFLEDVAGVAELNLADGVHPNEQGIERIVENILPMMSDFLQTHGVQSQK